MTSYWSSFFFLLHKTRGCSGTSAHFHFLISSISRSTLIFVVAPFENCEHFLLPSTALSLFIPHWLRIDKSCHLLKWRKYLLISTFHFRCASVCVVSQINTKKNPLRKRAFWRSRNEKWKVDVKKLRTENAYDKINFFRDDTLEMECWVHLKLSNNQVEMESERIRSKAAVHLLETFRIEISYFLTLFHPHWLLKSLSCCFHNIFFYVQDFFCSYYFIFFHRFHKLVHKKQLFAYTSVMVACTMYLI